MSFKGNLRMLHCRLRHLHSRILRPPRKKFWAPPSLRHIPLREHSGEVKDTDFKRGRVQHKKLWTAPRHHLHLLNHISLAGSRHVMGLSLPPSWPSLSSSFCSCSGRRRGPVSSSPSATSTSPCRRRRRQLWSGMMERKKNPL